MLTKEMSDIVRQATAAAEKAGATSLGIGAVVACALLSHMAGRDWRKDLIAE